MFKDLFPVPFVDVEEDFPNPLEVSARDDSSSDWKAVSFKITPQMVLRAYRKGIFPWPSNEIFFPWFSTNPRMVLKPGEFKVHHALRKRLNQAKRGIYREDGRDFHIEIYLDRDVKAVMEKCQNVEREGQAGTWIFQSIKDAYLPLAETDNLHAIGVYVDGKLQGGLYGVSIGRMFYGESMFHERKDLSKIAVYVLSRICLKFGIQMIDCQQDTELLRSLGGDTIPLKTFIEHVEKAVKEELPNWSELRGRNLVDLI